LSTEAATQIAIQIAMKADLLRSDLREGLVWFVNYAALDPTSIKVDDLDLHGAGMLPEDVEKFAHRWLGYSRSIDINHDGVGRPIHVIESFFNSEDVKAASWPINSHAVRFNISQSQEAMDGMRNGTLNSVSLDALTFNKVVRLPAAEAKAFAPNQEPFVPPTTVKKWAEELAQDGYPGITGVKQVGDGMFIAQRSCGLPVAITIKNGGLEASAASGPWAHIGMALCTSPSLTRNAIRLPDGPQGQQTTLIDSSVVGKMLAEQGLSTPEQRVSALEAYIESISGGIAGAAGGDPDPIPGLLEDGMEIT